MYLHIPTQSYPLSLADIQAALPHISLPANPCNRDLAPLGYCKVKPSPLPAAGPYQRASEAAPIQVGNDWLQQWTVIDELPPLDQLKRAAKALVDTRRAVEEIRNFLFPFPDGQLGTIEIDEPRHRENLSAQVQVAQALLAIGGTQQLPWRDGENVTHHLTPRQMIDVGLAWASRKTGTYENAWRLKGLIDAATTKETLHDLDLNSGWPD
ncbi:DUF4376 domain-containing protein [Parachitinimonas caeni]|uniref:DUF4376 domain-containing protein n=1 Tax=Parachitinimonas caeni TaxID=3031301 RepID=A0ABT7DWQ5_9NEIS|nr:DUF4376 domain-containing protein [Parachitinimonas caeni]MDK2124502.1 DUF4376 domain-containing protein [Parachitinimonas caeni]